MQHTNQWLDSTAGSCRRKLSTGPLLQDAVEGCIALITKSIESQAHGTITIVFVHFTHGFSHVFVFFRRVRHLESSAPGPCQPNRSKGEFSLWIYWSLLEGCCGHRHGNADTARCTSLHYSFLSARCYNVVGAYTLVYTVVSEVTAHSTEKLTEIFTSWSDFTADQIHPHFDFTGSGFTFLVLYL